MGYTTATISDLAAWNRVLGQMRCPHILQTWQWAEQKEHFGWQKLPMAWYGPENSFSAAAMVLKRKPAIGPLRLPFSLLYIPRGPMLDWDAEDCRSGVLASLEDLTRKQAAISIKIDPEVVLGTGIPGSGSEWQNPIGKALQSLLVERGWKYSPAQVQFRNTVFLDLCGSEDEWLCRMKQKTRYNLRLAERKGITVRDGSLADLPLVYHMYVETSLRDGFVIRSEEYYMSLWRSFLQQGLADLLIAECEGEPVSALFLFHYGSTAWYFYGMSTGRHNEKMPNYLIQWRAMQRAKTYGCATYDLWGAPEVFDETDKMWGVYRFKEGFGGQVLRTLGAWDYAPYPALNTLFTGVLPKLLNVMRRRRIQQERHETL